MEWLDEWRKEKVTDRLMVLLTAILSIAAFLTVAFAHYDVKRTVAAAGEDNKKLLEQQERQDKIDNLAWVGLLRFDLQPRPQENANWYFPAGIVFSNTGKSAARNVDILAVECPLPTGQIPAFGVNCTSNTRPNAEECTKYGGGGVYAESNSVIGPGVERQITLANNCLHHAGTLVPTSGTDGPTVTDIRTRTVKVWVWGHINYQDLYGKSHSQQFCGVYIWDWNTFIPNECPAGTNTVDSDPE